MQIAKQIRDRIITGKLKIGDKLSPERTMAQEFGTSRATWESDAEKAREEMYSHINLLKDELFL